MKNVIDWPKELVLLLITEWKKHPCLYDPNNEDYAKKPARSVALEKIVKVLKLRNAVISEMDVKTKLSNLRGQYCSELRRLKIKKFQSTNPNDEYESNIYWYQSLSFLKPFIGMKKPLKVLINIDQDQDQDADFDQESYDQVEMNSDFDDSPVKRIKLENMGDICMEQPAINITHGIPDHEDHSMQASPLDEQAFGEYVRSEISAIKDDLLRLEMKHEINQIIYDYRKKDLLKSLNQQNYIQ